MSTIDQLPAAEPADAGALWSMDNTPDPSTFYGDDERGYVDNPGPGEFASVH